MKRWHKGLAFGTAIGIVGVAFALTPLYLTIETRVGLNALFHARGVQQPTQDVAVVAIDGRSGVKMDLPDLPREWPRSIHGKLVDELTRRGAQVIVFDIDFRRPRNAEQDQLLADSIAASNRVVLVQHLTGRRQAIEDAAGRETGMVWTEELEEPMPVLANTAKALGPFPLPKLDAAVDQFWTFKSSAQDVATMPAAALQLFALQDFDAWRNALATATTLPTWFPESADQLKNAKLTREWMLNQRRLFEGNAELSDRMASALKSQVQDPMASRRLTALLGLYSGGIERYVNYYGPPGTIRTIPYHAVIKGSDPNVSPEALDFTEKVVFVGYSDLYDPGQPDRFYTIFTRDDGVDLSGVEIAATAFANLLDRRSVVPMEPALVLVILLVFGTVVGTVLYALPGFYGVPIAMGLAAAYIAGAAISFNSSYLWWPLITPVLFQFPAALLIGLFIQYRQQHKRASHISEAIRVYVPEDVSRVLTAPGLDNASINKVTYGTCLATDMAGFSTIAEKMGPGELAKFLNEYFDALALALKRNGVVVTEFRADAIMCAWTGSVDDPNVRTLPVLASLEAARSIAEFNQQRGLNGTLRIGMADGEFYVGHAGGGGHFVYSIVGDCANTASRIESLNKHLGTRILASSTVLAGQDNLLRRDIGNFRFVGKNTSMPITEILAMNSDATSRQVELAERFTEARSRFERGAWSDAAKLFESLQSAFGNDAPTTFLLNRARSHLAGIDVPEDPSIIIMSSK